MPDLGGMAYIEYESGTTRPRVVIDRLKIGSIITGSTGSGANIQRGETPTGTINGSNRSFTLANTPVALGTQTLAQSVAVFSDNVRVAPSEYTVVGTALTFNAGSSFIPRTVLNVDYNY